jgi:hypothetical protein
MATHVILPGVGLEDGFSHPIFERYLKDWREEAINAADNGIAAASVCHQATLIDLLLDGHPRHDWLSVMKDLLTNGERPIAYSDAFGKRLHKFGAQYLQSTIHSIHTRWWIERLVDPSGVDHHKFARMVLAKKQTNGLIYDMDVSETLLRHRMKVELSLSAVMSAEILSVAGVLSDSLKNELSTSLADPRKVPPLGYMTSEQFRLAALRLMGREELFPAGIEEHIEACAEGLEFGWSDFAMKSKVDAYMGTAKRTSRDKPIHSPLVACHVAALSAKVPTVAKRAAISDRLAIYAHYLEQNPLDIPAFQMRDVPIPFGSDMTPIETVCTSHLITKIGMGDGQ